MKTIRSSMIIILLSFFVGTQLSVVTSIKKDYGFFLFVQRWPGAECSGEKGCCFATTGATPDFKIHGLWPQYDDGSGGYPTKCDPNNKNPFDKTKIKDLIPSLEKEWPSLACPSGESLKIWKHEWEKHGTCSFPTLTQDGYFDAALKLKAKKNLLQILKKGNVEPNGTSYSFGTILQALTDGIEYVPGIECNKEKKTNTPQLYEVSFCVDKSGSNIIDCPVYQRVKNCDSKDKKIKFPKFGIRTRDDDLIEDGDLIP